MVEQNIKSKIEPTHVLRPSWLYFTKIIQIIKNYQSQKILSINLSVIVLFDSKEHERWISKSILSRFNRFSMKIVVAQYWKISKGQVSINISYAGKLHNKICFIKKFYSKNLRFRINYDDFWWLSFVSSHLFAMFLIWLS